MRRYLSILVLSVLHLAVSGALLMASAGASLARLDTGADPAGATRIVDAVGRALLYPIFIPGTTFLGTTSGSVGWLLLLANSLVWGVAVHLLLRWMRESRTRTRAGATMATKPGHLRT